MQEEALTFRTKRMSWFTTEGDKRPSGNNEVGVEVIA
jgi:hypothetical protein